MLVALVTDSEGASRVGTTLAGVEIMTGMVILLHSFLFPGSTTTAFTGESELCALGHGHLAPLLGRVTRTG